MVYALNCRYLSERLSRGDCSDTSIHAGHSLHHFRLGQQPPFSISCIQKQRIRLLYPVHLHHTSTGSFSLYQLRKLFIHVGEVALVHKSSGMAILS
ncbi:uncharacterized protein MELLADRAFT_85323 [Melampsora larici-populina 98AG31]|uniref:Uncharacterized protein n=1 Tax=Melampsora larici-populina (strain 98AG31 / pathotype 3-4-7) TaxID=747676 RepID=F4SCZ2_MELLP|nr:uncharacterized protein MELLADRAFT_85323 [Melampsora larici-populina 98AG31]EGF97479.1 hypothetical protein MELLADRAFT_85323 [Melampsora larici-populina 98AG31]